jgi:DNA-binding response OmpR family regulator
MRQKILIVDDEENILDLIDYNVRNAGYETKKASDGREGLNIFEKDEFDLVILDVMLPFVDGFELLKIIRKKSNVPVLMLTAKTEELDRVLGLELGADDYLVKPFSIRELLARIKAILRRTSDFQETENEKIVSKDIVLDLNGYKAFIGNNEVRLTMKEFELLKYLMQNKGRVFTRENLLNNIWGYDYYGDSRTVDVHIRHLRSKIEENLGENRYIKTIRGIGYKFEESL